MAKKRKRAKEPEDDFDDPFEEDEGAEEPDQQDIWSGLVDRLTAEAQQRVQDRLVIEQRWLEDLRQYEGRYDDATEAGLIADKRSTAFINLTRSKCDAMESKLYDMLFPTDDRNWGVDPTPVPEMAMEADRLDTEIDRLVTTADQIEDEQESAALVTQADGLAAKRAELEATKTEAVERAKLMADEIDDHLVEGHYPAICRDAIHDAVVAGVGITKGPLPLRDRVKRNWLRDAKTKEWSLETRGETEERIVFQHTSYWHLFPDSAALSFEDCESWMERHLMRRRDLQEFAQQPGVDQDAVREILEDGAQEVVPDFLLRLETIASETASSGTRERFILWEYRGPLEQEEMEELLAALSDDDEPVEFDPLMMIDAVVWFCQGKILKIGLNHLDSNPPMYSFFRLTKEPWRLWATGLPYLMRVQQEIVNGAWRGMLDNAALASFPQVEVDENVVQPVGAFKIEPYKLWRRLPEAGDRKGLIFHQVPIHQNFFQAIIEMAMTFTDQETNVSVLTQGDQGNTTRTAGGMALLMNNVNVVFRRIIKNFDDGITKPNIERSYHYLMQFSPRDQIKGDYRVQARGSSVLLVREVQAQNLLLLAMQASVHPLMGKHLKMRPLMKRLMQSMMIASDDVLKTEEELKADEAAEAEALANQPPDPALVKLEVDQQRAHLDARTKIMLAQLDIEGELVKLAIQRNISLEEAAARLMAVREQIESKERLFMGEAAMEQRLNPDGGGSGGYLSG